jgi:hypothetical protein
VSRLPFWIPPNKPALPKPIPKLIVKGTTGTLAARQQAVANNIQEIKQFYLKAAHNHSLGIVDLSWSRLENDRFRLLGLGRGRPDLPGCSGARPLLSVPDIT